MSRLTLLPHQQVALKQALRLEHPALFMEMRLGKTLVALRVLEARCVRRALIVAPKSVVPVWMSLLRSEGHTAIHLRAGHDRVLPRGWYVVTYEFLRRHPDFAKMEWDGVVADESTKFKNPRSQLAKLFMREWNDTGTRMILSGLPRPETSLEYFPQFKFLHGQMMGCADFWQWRFHKFREIGFDWWPKPGTRSELQNYVEAHSVRMTRRGLNIGSRKVYEQRYVTMNLAQRTAYSKILDEWTIHDRTTPWRVVIQTWVEQLSSGWLAAREKGQPAKMISARKALLLEELIDEQWHGERVVVFCRFLQEIAELEKRLGRLTKVITVTGATTMKEREELRKQFHYRDEGAVFLCQQQCCRMGIDLSCADTAVFFSNSWSLEDRMQAEDRIIHPKKTEPVLIVDLITRGTVGVDVVKALRGKKADAKETFQRIYRQLRTAAESNPRWG